MSRIIKSINSSAIICVYLRLFAVKLYWKSHSIGASELPKNANFVIIGCSPVNKT
jgi:hypothetical protein